MRDKFRKYVAGAKPCMPSLPVNHTCDGYRFRDIVDTEQISARECSVFHELLIYLFYGRPAYRPSSWKKAEAKSSYPYMPCSIVLRNDSVSAPKRIAPFDTGAYDEGLYKEYLHPDMNMEDFLLSPSLDMPPRLVSKFFGSNHNYYSGKPLSLTIPPTQFEAKAYYDIINREATMDLDDRGSVVEIQGDAHLLLNSDNVLFVVLPKAFMSDKDIRDTIINKWKARFSIYDIYPGKVQEIMSTVYYYVERYLRKTRYL